MENKLSNGPLLNDKGELNEAGYAFSLVKEYSRKQIKGLKSRIKEWDYYYFGDDEYGIALTIDDNSYMGLGSASLLNFKNKRYANKANMFWLPFGKVKMPETSVTGSVKVEGKNYYVNFINENGKRHLSAKFDNFKNGDDLVVEVELELTTPHSMVIATPFLKNKHFYYNQKINLLKVSGYFKCGNLKHTFKPDTYGVLDWGRGIWTYSNTWYWSSLNVKQGDNVIGWNFGYGFGDTSAASENMFFVNQDVFKLEDVEFVIPKNEKGKDKFLKPWLITNKAKTINITFTPIIDRHDHTNAIIIEQNAHQVFGHFEGTIIIENKTFEIKNALGFAEKVKNRW